MGNREVTAGVHCNSEQPEIHTTIGCLSSVLVVLDVQEVLEIMNIYTMLSVKNTKYAWKQWFLISKFVQEQMMFLDFF